jgi:hypothetical protein
VGDVQLGPVTHISPADVQDLWVRAGGDPEKALTAAAIVFSTENPAGNAGLVNDTPETGDYSVGLWQINYAGDLRALRTAQFGSPEDLASDPLAQARAVVSMSRNGTNWQPWATADFGYPDYSQPVTEPKPGSRVAVWLAAHGGGVSSAGFTLPPKPVILASLGILAFGAWATWTLLDLPNPLRQLGFVR